MKIAIITGITGQDGSYLAEYLLTLDYHIHGIIRRASNFNTDRIDHIMHHNKLHLHHGDLTDLSCLISILTQAYNTPNVTRIEFYNLAAQSHVQVSFANPVYTANVDAIGTLNCLEAIRMVDTRNIVRFYQASTSELYGKVQETPQSETTPFYPRSPYAVAKLYSFWIVKNYREAYGMYACNGILFNHESPRRGKTFVTRKITTCLNKVLTGKMNTFSLGNIYSKRDWGHAKDYVRGMYLMLQQDPQNGEIEDLVLSTNETHSVKDFINVCMECLHINQQFRWEGEGLSEKGILTDGDGNEREIITISPKYFRPTEVDLLLGNSAKAREKLGWEPEYSFQQLVDEMVKCDCEEYISQQQQQQQQTNAPILE